MIQDHIFVLSPIISVFIVVTILLIIAVGTLLLRYILIPVKRLNYFLSLIENMNHNISFMEMLDYINITFSKFIPYNYIGIALIDEDREMISATYGVSDDKIKGLPEKLIRYKSRIKETSLGHLLETGNVRIINDLEKYTKGKPVKQYNKTLLEAGVKASITLPLMVSGKAVGVIFFSSYKKNVYRERHIQFLKTLVNSIAISFHQNIFIHNLLFSSTLALANLAEARDEDTGNHMERIRVYSRALAEWLYEKGCYEDEITYEFIEMIDKYSPLHDIGKVAIQDSILLKPGKLTNVEFDTMKQHTMFGGKVLRDAEENMGERGKYLFSMGIEIAEGHHEKWNGGGYPYGRHGDDIPLSARIVAVADVFDALTSKRPYKKPFSFEESFQIIIDGSGEHFDPQIVKVFEENRNRIFHIYRRLNEVSEQKIEKTS